MRILVGITGGIAAYKSAELIRKFVESGHEVRAVPTENALRFIGAATLEALTHNSVHHDLYSDVEEVRHIELAKWAELIVVAPATASFLARTASGIADDLLGNIILASTAKQVFAPAMHTEMWQHLATQANVSLLRNRGVFVMEPASGRLTGTDTGVGRLPEADQIAEFALRSIRPRDLLGKRVLVIAGGTREPIDPVRYIGNRSSGKQGIALAEEALRRGAEVSMIAANFVFNNPDINIINVVTTAELQSAIDTVGLDFDYLIMPAAVSDYRVAVPHDSKLKKSQTGPEFDLHLIENPDVIKNISSAITAHKLPTKLVGFAAETLSGEALVEAARNKLTGKGLTMVVANQVSDSLGFEADHNVVTIVGKDFLVDVSNSKREIAKVIYDLLLQR